MPLSPSAPPEQGRINLRELKTQIVKRVGAERADRYFSYLNRLLSHKLSKREFNRLCVLTLGHDNLPLHNQLIHSILKNAFQAKVPPPVSAASKLVVDNGFNSSPASAPVAMQTGLPNGDLLPPTLWRSRSGGVRRIIDRPSPLGPNGRADFSSHHQPSRPRDAERVAMENGDLTPYGLKRSVQHQLGGPLEQLAKRPRLEKLSSDHGLASVHIKDLAEMVLGEDREEAEHQRILNSARGPLRAPLGIPFCPTSVNGARRSLTLSTSTSDITSNYVAGELCQTKVLRKRMEVIAQAQGLAGVPVDCANLLNIGLDSYLKGLIKSCVELVGARIGHKPVKQRRIHKQQPHSKAINGVWLGNHIQVQSSAGSSEGNLDPRNHYPISLQDFRVAMELNPHKLGEHWPLLFEKICLGSFEE